MTFSDETLGRIWDKTNGYCKYCEKKLAWINYGNPYGKGSWEVDHSQPISKGGTDHLNNLVPACTSCNREKGDMTAGQYRRTFESESDTPLQDLIVGMIVVGGFIWSIKKIFNLK